MFAYTASMSSTSELCCAPISTRPLSSDEADELAGVLKALADPIRLQLVSLIASSGEECACDLPEAVGKSQPTVSHHLKLLVEAGIIHREQRGKWAWFQIDADRLNQVCSILC